MTNQMINQTQAEQSCAVLREMSIDDLRAEFKKAVEITANHVARLALIWAELERRGEDMSALRSGIGAYLASVAAGRLIPEAVVRLAGNRTALRAIAYLSVGEQRRIITAGTIAVKRHYAVEDVPIHRLTPADVGRAFDVLEGRIRSPAEQSETKPRRARDPQKRIILSLTADQHRALLAHADRSKRSAAALILDEISELLK